MYFLEFDPLDYPPQLSKVGNWVITFINSKNELENIQLTITNVIPRQAHNDIQIRKLIIQSTSIETQWEILYIEAFNGKLNQEITLSVNESTTQQLIKDILKEFEKYDVNIQLISQKRSQSL